jgi:TonB family protein
MSVSMRGVPAAIVLLTLSVRALVVAQSLDLERHGFPAPPPGVADRLVVGDLERVRDVGDSSGELRVLHVQNVSTKPIVGLRAEWSLWGGRRLAVDNRWTRTSIKPGERVTFRFSVDAKALEAIAPGTLTSYRFFDSDGEVYGRGEPRRVARDTLRVTDPGGRTHLVSGMRDAWYAVSTDDGVTTSAPRRMGGTPLLENVVPRAIAASRNDVVYLAWEGRRSSEVLYYFARSTDGGRTFRTRRLITPQALIEQLGGCPFPGGVNEDSGRNDGRVAIVLSEDGRDVVIRWQPRWYRTRAPFVAQRGFGAIEFEMSSSDGGATWSPRTAQEVLAGQARKDPAGFLPAIGVECVPPRYPPAGEQAEIGGTVRVRVVVGTDGRAKRDVEIVESLGREFDAAVLEAVRRWRYLPATLGRKPVEATVETTLTFGPRTPEVR